MPHAMLDTALDTVIVPCGGLGTRLHPATRWVAKELLPVALRPLLWWTLDEVKAAGLARAVVVTSPAKPAVADAARAWAEERGGGVRVECVPQPDPRGLGDALLRARPLLAGAAFAVALPDNLFDPAGPNPTAGVLAIYRRTGLATVLLAEVSRADAGSKGPTGRARTRTGPDGTLRVTAVAGKGAGARFDTAGEPSALTPIGRFVFPGGVFAEFDEVARGLRPGEELDDVPVLQRYADRGVLAGSVCRTRWWDVGVPEGYREAVEALPAAAVRDAGRGGTRAPRA